MIGYLAYRGTKSAAKTTVKAPGAFVSFFMILFVYFPMMVFYLTVCVLQLLVWLIIAFDWMLKVVPPYKRWRKVHQFPSEKDPDHNHVF